MISIGTLAKKAQCRVPTIRFYEKAGLMPKPERGTGGQRRYSRSDLARLMFIRRCRDLDMPLERIGVLLALQAGGRHCQETLDFFKDQRRVLKERIEALQAFDITLSAYIHDCQTGCLPRGEACGLFEALESS